MANVCKAQTREAFLSSFKFDVSGTNDVLKDYGVNVVGQGGGDGPSGHNVSDKQGCMDMDTVVRRAAERCFAAADAKFGPENAASGWGAPRKSDKGKRKSVKVVAGVDDMVGAYGVVSSDEHVGDAAEAASETRSIASSVFPAEKGRNDRLADIIPLETLDPCSCAPSNADETAVKGPSGGYSYAVEEGSESSSDESMCAPREAFGSTEGVVKTPVAVKRVQPLSDTMQGELTCAVPLLGDATDDPVARLAQVEIGGLTSGGPEGADVEKEVSDVAHHMPVFPRLEGSVKKLDDGREVFMPHEGDQQYNKVDKGARTKPGVEALVSDDDDDDNGKDSGHAVQHEETEGAQVYGEMSGACLDEGNDEDEARPGGTQVVPYGSGRDERDVTVDHHEACYAEGDDVYDPCAVMKFDQDQIDAEIAAMEEEEARVGGPVQREPVDILVRMRLAIANQRESSHLMQEFHEQYGAGALQASQDQ